MLRSPTDEIGRNFGIERIQQAVETPVFTMAAK
jgi:hypothetical protein